MANPIIEILIRGRDEASKVVDGVKAKVSELRATVMDRVKGALASALGDGGPEEILGRLTVAGTAVALGVQAIQKAWEWATKDIREAEQATQDLLDATKKLEEQRLERRVPGLDAKETVGATSGEIARLQALLATGNKTAYKDDYQFFGDLGKGIGLEFTTREKIEQQIANLQRFYDAASGFAKEANQKQQEENDRAREREARQRQQELREIEAAERRKQELYERNVRSLLELRAAGQNTATGEAALAAAQADAEKTLASGTASVEQRAAALKRLYAITEPLRAEEEARLRIAEQQAREDQAAFREEQAKADRLQKANDAIIERARVTVLESTGGRKAVELDAIRDKVNEYIAALEAEGVAYDDIKTKAAEYEAALKNLAESRDISRLEQTLIQSAQGPLATFFREGIIGAQDLGEAFGNLANAVAAALANIAATLAAQQIIQGLGSLFGVALGGGGGGKGIAVDPNALASIAPSGTGIGLSASTAALLGASAGAAGGDNITLSVQALDARSVRTMLLEEKQTIAAAVADVAASSSRMRRAIRGDK